MSLGNLALYAWPVMALLMAMLWLAQRRQGARHVSHIGHAENVAALGKMPDAGPMMDHGLRPVATSLGHMGQVAMQNGGPELVARPQRQVQPLLVISLGTCPITCASGHFPQTGQGGQGSGDMIVFLEYR